MATARQIEAYRKRLAKITAPTQLTPECINAVMEQANGVITGGTGAPYATTGTIAALQYDVREGMFGPAIRVQVKLCTKCVDQPSGNCIPTDSLPWITVSWFGRVRRNGDGGEQS